MAWIKELSSGSLVEQLAYKIRRWRATARNKNIAVNYITPQLSGCET